MSPNQSFERTGLNLLGRFAGWHRAGPPLNSDSLDGGTDVITEQADGNHGWHLYL